MSLRESVEAIVEAIVGPRLRAGVAYPFRVETQHADDTLDLIPEAGPFAAMTRVPITYGEPGIRARVRKGARVFVEFASGDQSQPMVTGWASGSVEEITITADRVRLADGDMKVARLGDLIAAQMPAGGNSAGPIVWTPLPDPSPLAKVYGTIISGSAFTRSK